MESYISEVFFDVETKNLFNDQGEFNPKDLGVSIVSVYKRKVDSDLVEIEGEMQSFWEQDFNKMWPIFQEADRIIGFNSLNFDVPALQPYADFPLSKLPHLDILLMVKEVFGKRISLDSIAKETLGKEKSDVGVNAVLYWQEGGDKNLEKLRKYCEMDVEITKEIYDFVVKNGYLNFKDRWNTQRHIKLDFTYPEDPTKQIGLF